MPEYPLLYDALRRNITYLRVSLTDRCNYRCRYCMPPEGVDFHSHDDVLRYEELLRLLRIFSEMGIKTIRLTGGEPLARKGAVDFTENLLKEGLFDEVLMTTNGHYFESHAKRLFQAGLKRVNFSLDSLRPDRFRHITLHGDLDIVQKAIDKALDLGYAPVKINTVVIKGINDDEVEELLAYAIEKKIHLRFIETMPIGNPGFFGPESFYPIGKVKKRCEARYTLTPTDHIPGEGPASCFQVEGTATTVGFIGALTENFCSRCNRMRITSTGDLYPCLDHETHVPLRELLRDGSSDDDVAGMIIQALRIKPESHDMELERKDFSDRPMHAIGG